MTDDSLLGRQVDEYRLEALLGHGGMARVYRGLDTRLKRRVAIKVIDTPFRADSDYEMRFEREAQAVAQLDHPHIVRLYRYGEADGLLYMAMQYIEGADLGFVLASYRADGDFIGSDDARRIIREVCLALDYAHSRGVIHRDVKPSNIVLDKQGRAILTDFGLALLTEIGTRGQILGSPHYMAPEQAISSAGAVPQSDLYSVGVILYEMFTGQLPFNAEVPMDVALLQISETPRPPRELRPAVSPQLEIVILKCLAKEPAQRYPDGAALAEALDQALAAEPAKAIAPTTPSLTIPQRVGMELVAHPLPPLPAVIAEAPPPPTLPELPSAKAPPAAPASQRPLNLPGASAIVMILVAVAFGLLAAWFIFGLMPTNGNPSKPAATFGPTPALTAAAVPETSPNIFLPVITNLGTLAVALTSTPTIPSPATPAPATSTPTTATPATATPATPTPASYELRIVKGTDGNSLTLVNQSAAVFPLGPLRLGDGRGQIQGTDWGVMQLAGGACVTAGKDNAGRNLPPGLNCQLVGQPLVRGGKDSFWKANFGIYYSDVRIGTCDKAQTECLIRISR